MEDLQRDCALSSANGASDKDHLILLAEEEIEQEETTTTTSSTAPEDMPLPQTCSKTSTMSSGMSRARSSSSSILDLASSLQTQLSKFGHRLDDTRERLEDTSRCYELLDKVKFLFRLLLKFSRMYKFSSAAGKIKVTHAIIFVVIVDKV